MTFLALPWFVLATTGSPTRMSIVLAVELAPVAMLGIPSGAVIARWGARRTMLVADLARAPLIASIPLLHELGLLSFPLLLVLVALVGVFIAPYFASQALILPELVGDDEHVVAQATALVEGARRATSLLGPAAAGILIATFSAPVVLYVDAATFLLSFALLLLGVPHRPPLAAERRRQGDPRGDPLRAPRSDAARPLLHCPPRERLRADARRGSHGARLRGVLQLAGRRRLLRGVRHRCRAREPRRGEARRTLRAARLGATAFVALTLPVFALAFELPVPAIVLALALSSFFGPIVNAPLMGVITMRSPEAIRAKVMTGVITLAVLAGPSGLLIAGPLLESWGARPVFLLVAFGQLLAVDSLRGRRVQASTMWAWRPLRPVSSGGRTSVRSASMWRQRLSISRKPAG